MMMMIIIIIITHDNWGRLLPQPCEAMHPSVLLKLAATSECCCCLSVCRRENANGGEECSRASSRFRYSCTVTRVNVTACPGDSGGCID